MEFDNEKRGVLFTNNRKADEKHADYTGNVTVDGVEYWLDGYKKVSKKGDPFLSLRLRPKQARPAPDPYDSPEAVDPDDIPF